MGTDNLFHKRKAKAAKNLERQKSKRSSYKKILIVCEGEKTEPYYFQDLIQYHKLNTANVAIDGSCGSSPRSIYNHAAAMYEEERRKGNPYDGVYCVFDKDSHETYVETVQIIANHKPPKVFHATTSIPCFEYWILLHFEYTTKAYASTGKNSIADEVIKDLLRYMPDYTKGKANVYTTLAAQVERAITFAAKSNHEANVNHTDTPTTQIGKLVKLLREVKG